MVLSEIVCKSFIFFKIFLYWRCICNGPKSLVLVPPPRARKPTAAIAYIRPYYCFSGFRVWSFSYLPYVISVAVLSGSLTKLRCLFPPSYNCRVYLILIHLRTPPSFVLPAPTYPPWLLLIVENTSSLSARSQNRLVCVA